MKRLTALVAAGIIAFSAAQAQAVDPDKPLKLPGTVTIVAFDQLEATALALHPGSSLLDTDLDEAYGKYVYQVELEDADGIEWEVELDALTGHVLKNHQDT
ncbi:PepSY domain-containing protein [Pseudomonas sp. O64]|uniref:PepSY domain-containing protein n=1 Tax=Pseudomonas TaxID=286 RepID=UPI000BA05AA2|nr:MULTISPECIES: PepSY domain-containing protein [unclassified Pseudomonas]MCV2230546.1 PepSY domain-containing protein [Pseudomonas sp. AU10]OZO01118.1 peptidase [Pseudomonas sp. IB20]UNM22150.1 PepSY domain-containing protein [Pseudomonas sp. ArH3a]